MQDQGKRLIIAVALALGVLMLWQKIFPPKDQPKDGAGSGSAIVAPGSNGAPVISVVKPTTLVGHDGTAPDAPVLPITLEFPKFTATFSNIGGTLHGWHLKDERYIKDATKGELIAGDGELGLEFTKDSTFKLPAHVAWTGTKVSDHEVQYELSTDTLDIVKTYDVAPEAFIVKLTIAITVKADARQRIAITNFQFQDPKQTGGGSSRIQPRVWNSSTLREGTIVQSELKDVQEHPRFEKDITWTGFEHPFLLVAFSPKPVLQGGTVEKHTYADDKGNFETDLIYQPVDLKPNAPAFTREIAAYLGPKNYDQLDEANRAAGFTTGFNQTVDFGWFGFLGKKLLWLLLKFQGVVGNWGVAIILLTVVVKLATLYWMTKSMRSMKAMAVLGPQIKELNVRYKEDKARLQTETMALYKQNGANPLSGCLPMFLQMPIWIALYRMLSNAGELYRQPFIPGWISDLTAADPYYVLPVVLVVTMFAQAKLTPQNPDPAQRTQQRLMQYGMPLLFGGMAFVFPAGLTLYIFTNTCLSALHSIYMNKFDKKSMELTAKIQAAQAAAAAAKLGGAAKGAKNANVAKKAVEPVRAITSESDSETSDDEVAEPAASAAPRVAPRQRPKKKKGRR
ncbi:MAG: membrane protein insertase YidC [Deltaproteobacteria bacterium]